MQESGALVHDGEAKAVGRRGGIETATVIAYAQVEHAAGGSDGDLDVLGARVADGVGERLLHDAEQRGLQPWRVARSGQANVDGDRDAGALGRPRECLDRGGRAELVERRGAQLADQPAEPGDLLVDPADGLVDGGPQALGIAAAAGGGEQHVQRAERLQRVVVQCVRPAPPLRLGRLHGVAHALLLEFGQERGFQGAGPPPAISTLVGMRPKLVRPTGPASAVTTRPACGKPATAARSSPMPRGSTGHTVIRTMTRSRSSAAHPLRVLVAGGGVAAIEAVLALHALAGDRVSIEMLAPGDDFVERPSSVLSPFSGEGAPHCPWAGSRSSGSPAAMGPSAQWTPSATRSGPRTACAFATTA